VVGRLALRPPSLPEPSAWHRLHAPDNVVEATAWRLSANVHPDKTEGGDRQEFLCTQNAKTTLLDSG
jgi:hypothetical protein